MTCDNFTLETKYGKTEKSTFVNKLTHKSLCFLQELRGLVEYIIIAKKAETCVNFLFTNRLFRVLFQSENVASRRT